MLNIILCRAKYYILASVLFLSFSVLGQSISDQSTAIKKSTNSDQWQSALITTAGGNIAHGVAVFYRSVVCNSEKTMVLLKFVNENQNDVSIEWADGFILSSGERVHDERVDKVKTLELEANSQIEGSCLTSSDDFLLIDLSLYVNEPGKNLRYTPTYIDVTK